MIDRQSANSSLGIVNRRQLTKRGPLLDRCPLRLFAKVLWVLVCGHGHNLVAKTKLLGSLAIVAVWFPLVTLDASPATCEAACPRSSLDDSPLVHQCIVLVELLARSLAALWRHLLVRTSSRLAVTLWNHGGHQRWETGVVAIRIHHVWCNALVHLVRMHHAGAGAM